MATKLRVATAGDMWEVAVWDDALTADQREVYLTFQVHNEAIVIPETIDCIRALADVERDGAASIAKTDAALGIMKQFLAHSKKSSAQVRTTMSRHLS